ncbi:GLE1-like protein-domain-containing protein [Tirmania nivea]|nr:GLE1-like protein-domain-containing protein [Tirmania nivea]
MGSPLSERKQVQSTYTKSYQSGTRAPENTPAAAFADFENMDREALGDEIKKILQGLEENADDRNTQEIIYRLEALIGGLRGYAESDNHDNQIQFVLEELTNIGAIQVDAAQRVLTLCQRGKRRMSQTAIISRWLVHNRLYGGDTGATPNHKFPGWTSIFTPGSEIRSFTTSPSSPFVFQSPQQQKFLPLQSRSFYASPSRPSKRKSDMAESIASLRKKLDALHARSEAIEQARRVNAVREHERMMRQYHNQVQEGHNKVKVEMTLDTQLQRLLEERKAQEEAVRQAKLRAEEEARRQEEMRKEAQRQRQAAEAAARQRAAEEEERKKQEEAAAKKRVQERVQEEAEKKAREEAERKAQEAQKKQEQEVREKHEAAAKEQALAQAKVTGEGVATVAPTGVYGRKSLESENAAMRKLLAALKDVRIQVKNNRDLFKAVNVKRRALNPKLGQLNGEIAQTNLVRNFIVNTLAEIKGSGVGPMVDASIFQLNRDPRLPVKPPAQVPLVFVWMINELGKMVVRQVEAESAVSIKTANPIGVAVVSSLARDLLLANGRSFIDIIIARLWKKCPILQGVLGPEETVGQRMALGWQKKAGEWEGDEQHINRMVGYCAGFAAIAGRNFMSTQNLNNPYPPFNLWFILAYMANNPERLTNTHFFCIKAILEVSGDALRKVYGPQGSKLADIIMGQLSQFGVKQQFAGGFGLQALAAKFENDKKFS